LALVAVAGPAMAATSRASGNELTRTATVPLSEAAATDVRAGTMSVSGPGQNRDASSLASGVISLATLPSCSMPDTMQGSAFVDGRPLISKTRAHATWSYTETASP
jgi:hypothetical protein